MLRRFADVMALSDFQSFQAMESTSNIGDITAMTRLLGAHGPVMLAHYKPDDGGQATFDADVRRPLTAPMLRRLRGDGLFALSFMDGANLDGQAGTLAFVSAATASFGAAPRPRRAGRP